MGEYRTRQPIEDMLKLNPKENLEAVLAIFEALSEKGYRSFQWSGFSQPMNRPGASEKLREAHPEYDELESKEKRKIFRAFSDSQPDYFFIEAFGPQFLRGDGETFEACAQILKQKAEERESCLEHEWAYTHSNGNKTCAKCGYFTRCSVEEAAANYESGEVEIDERKVLKFNRQEAICPCGSHQIHFLRDSFFPEKRYKCPACGNFVKKELKEYEKGFLPETFEEQAESMVAFEQGAVVHPTRIEKTLARFVSEMLKHALYVEEIPQSDFLEWLFPHLKRFVEIWDVYFEKDGEKYHLEKAEIAGFEAEGENIGRLTFETLGRKAAEEIVSAEARFAEGMEAIAKALIEED